MTPRLPPEAEPGQFSTLRELVARLRRECPWDREQTHTSLRPNLLEECYEALEAIDGAEPVKLCQELGDLLLQVLLQAQIATDAGEFTLEEVIQGITRKLIRRHPHIFGSARAESGPEVADHWDRLKREEGGSLLDSVPPAMPALAYSQEIQSRAARAGFDWAEVGGVLEKVAEELKEVQQAASPEEKTREMGDLLFGVVNLARWLGVDAEAALRQTSGRFRQRFAYIEAVCRERGLSLPGLSLSQLDALWAEAKQRESGGEGKCR